jgi:hypothetical protein
LNWLAGGLSVPERPVILRGAVDAVDRESRFDVILGRNWLAGMDQENRETSLKASLEVAEKGGLLLIAEPDPVSGTTMSDLLPAGVLDEETENLLKESERRLVKTLAEQRSPEVLSRLLMESGWSDINVEKRIVSEKRVLADSLLTAWFSTGKKGNYGTQMAEEMGMDTWNDTAAALKSLLTGRTVLWQTGLLLVTAESTV